MEQTDLSEHPAPLLVASDVDGTFLTSAERVTPRLRHSIDAMLKAGTVLTLATGRPARWLKPVLDQLTVRPVCVCGNGAVIYDSNTDTILAAHELQPDVLSRIVEIAQTAMDEYNGAKSPDPAPKAITPGFAVERIGKSIFSEGDQFLVEPGFDHIWDSEEHTTVSIAELVSVPAIKLFIRAPELSSRELYEIIAGHIDTHLAHVTYSFDGGLLEVAAPGVTKATGLAELANDIGVDPARVVAFGDMANDSEMLQWAGLGVAMGNAPEAVKALADIATTTNDDDGVAAVLEAWFS